MAQSFGDALSLECIMKRVGLPGILVPPSEGPSAAKQGQEQLAIRTGARREL